MQKITTLTMNPTVDVSADIDRVEPVKKLRCTNPRREPGGGGINVARAIHVLSGEATACFACGGVMGDMLLQMLQEQGVVSSPLRVEAATRESFSVREGETGRQYRFVLPGQMLRKEEWQWCLEVMQSQDEPADFLVASGSLPPGVDVDFYARLAHGLRRRKTKLIIDTSGKPLQAALEAGVYMIKPNLRELSEAAGAPLEDKQDQENFCRNLIAEGKCEIVILSLGHKGALFVTRERRIRLAALEVAVESSIGAGDSFVVGTVYALARGMEPEEAFYYGMAAGIAALVTPGTELCRREDTERFHQKLRKRQQASKVF